MEYNKKNREIVLNRELNKLDKFVIKFVSILGKYVEYVIISGYLSILFGRSRATEDIDFFIKPTTLENFRKLYNELIEKGFWCLNSEEVNEIFSYLNEGLAVRFSIEGKPIPNCEIKFPKSKLDEETFADLIKVILFKRELNISSLERQIAFKKYYLKSDKDIEDAIYIEELFKEKLDHNKINIIKNHIENDHEKE